MEKRREIKKRKGEQVSAPHAITSAAKMSRRKACPLTLVLLPRARAFSYSYHHHTPQTVPPLLLPHILSSILSNNTTLSRSLPYNSLNPTTPQLGFLSPTLQFFRQRLSGTSALQTFQPHLPAGWEVHPPPWVGGACPPALGAPLFLLPIHFSPSVLPDLAVACPSTVSLSNFGRRVLVASIL